MKKIPPIERFVFSPGYNEKNLSEKKVTRIVVYLNLKHSSHVGSRIPDQVNFEEGPRPALETLRLAG